jgi:hypothetical protein
VLALEFLERHVKVHYVKAGKPTAEQRCIHSALRVLRESYGHTIAAEFGPLAPKALRAKIIQPQMVKRRFHRPNGERIEKTVCVQWSRKYVNKTISRIRQFFRIYHETGVSTRTRKTGGELGRLARPTDLPC